MTSLVEHEEFYVGRQFDSFKEFNDMFSDWCVRNFCLTRIEDSHKITANLGNDEMRERLVYQSVKVVCLHYGHRAPRMKSQDQAIEKPTLRRGCPFEICLRLTGNSLQIKKVNLNHNHVVSALIYSRYPKNRKISDFEMAFE